MTEVAFEPYNQAFAANPYPTYARLRRERPIFYSPEYGLTFITRYRDIYRLLTDKRLGRTMDHLLSAEALQQKHSSPEWLELPNYSRYVRVNLLESEGDDHARIRRLLSKALQPKRVAMLSDRINAIRDQLLAELVPRQQMDFLAEYAEVLPVQLISELLGWPREHRHRLRPWSAAIVRLYEKDHSKADRRAAEKAVTDFAAKIDELANERTVNPQEDLISALVASEDSDTGLSREELIATCMLILNAGHEATVNAAGNGMLALLRHPEQMKLLKQQPELIESAVDEMLRYDAPLHMFHRYVLEDFDFEGYSFKQGDTLGLLYGAANRDPEIFDNPDTFDIQRNPNRHLAFGAATHFCLGAPLAKLELRALFNGLLSRTTQIELEVKTPEYYTGLVFRGLKELRIRWRN